MNDGGPSFHSIKVNLANIYLAIFFVFLALCLSLETKKIDTVPEHEKLTNFLE